jgi:3'(2'), 5'-bisphosphate nucleotidase
VTSQELSALLDRVVPVAVKAGDAVMDIYARDFSTMEKEDKSPLTEADLASHHAIVEGLAALDTGFPILSEESKAVPYDVRSGWNTFWLVDPLDGTKEFIKRNGEFTVNIALIEEGEPVLGVVYAPVLKTTYAAAAGAGGYVEKDGNRSDLRSAAYSGGELRVVASRSHAGPETEELISKLRAEVGDVELVSIGSSLKLCLVAEGKAHLYPRLGPTMEWDVAAAHAVVNASGAQVTQVDGSRFEYNKRDLLNPFFIVSSEGVPPLWSSTPK